MRRLAQLGYTSDEQLKFWRDVWQKPEDDPLFWDFLRQEEQTAREYRRWFPRLQAFAAECRRALSVPAVDGFSAVEREQYRVLLAQMQELAGPEGRRWIPAGQPNRADILTTTRVGLASARQVFGDSGPVILLEEERDRWFSEIYTANDKAFWWYAFAWWYLREGLVAEDEEWIRRHYPIPAGSSYWMVGYGIQVGDLAGTGGHELWRWDGRRAEFVALYSLDTI
jgi:hypothetical protein